MYFRIWRMPGGDLVPVVVGHKHLGGQDLPPTDGKPYFEFPPDYGLWKHEHKQQYLLNLLNAMTCRCRIRMETVRRKFSASYSGNPFTAL